MNEDPNARLIRDLKAEVERLRMLLRMEGIEINIDGNKVFNLKGFELVFEFLPPSSSFCFISDFIFKCTRKFFYL